MDNPHKYRATDKMSDLICDNYALLMVMSRFGLSLGFGEKTVGETCQSQGVDCHTFLAVANFLNSGNKQQENDFSVAALMEYLKRAHTYFLDFNLPAIRRKLIEAIDCSGADDVAILILKFYDAYVREVRRHMEYENKEVFGYVENLLRGHLDAQYRITVFAEKHNQIGIKLKELKNIIIKYYPEKENDLLNAVLFDIFNCEQDLNSHCSVEDHLFVPAVEALEEQLAQQTHKDAAADQPNEEGAGGEGTENLSQREQEVITCVAKGMSNKEIADRLCLSVHTVITHRRNIARKLQIHSPAGLTIYAIVNKLVELNEIKDRL